MKNPAELTFLDREALVSGRKGYRFLRRAQDVILSMACLLILLPVMVLIALVVFLDDPHGSPFFTQTRIGLDGKPFRLYKFRSMKVDAEKELPALMTKEHMNGPVFKMKGDPRITRFGRFLRASALDELPQLLNILKGEMSLVGPRPVVAAEVAQYTDYQRQRLMITPGLTCYWQVEPNHNDIPFEEWIEMDLRYIRERSFLVDWKIIFRTVKAVFRMQGI